MALPQIQSDSHTHCVRAHDALLTESARKTLRAIPVAVLSRGA